MLPVLANHSHEFTPTPLRTRRDFLIALAATLLLSSGAHSAAQAAELPPYCSLDPNIDLTRFKARSSTGNNRMDKALISELKHILQVMQISPGFRIIDDLGGPNAFAIDRTLVRGTKGTVLFGINLLSEELVAKAGGYAIAGIAAHECSHVFQYQSPFGARLTRGARTAKPMELHADFLAGFYLGQKRGSDLHIETFAKSLYDKGDWNFNDPGHHGTPDERVNAMKRGFALARDKKSFSEAAENGAIYVLSL
ncbi:MAG: hypothetical protein HYR72_27065 [Deltaproteobacteria bacterium]|nr:hypothetical protein [Deltaproteobacteria bacterium]MBI3390324.1 hypothetical protein [Deltaproteobacteria bacterium]